MLSKLNAVADKYRELEALLSDPDVMADMEKWQRYTREHAALTPIIEAYTAYQRALATIDEDKEMLTEADAEMKEMLTEEIAEAEADRDDDSLRTRPCECALYCHPDGGRASRGGVYG